jgi:hypothetical protein
VKDSCTRSLFRDNAIEKTILRILGAFDFSHRLVRRDGGGVAMVVTS